MVHTHTEQVHEAHVVLGCGLILVDFDCSFEIFVSSLLLLLTLYLTMETLKSLEGETLATPVLALELHQLVQIRKSCPIAGLNVSELVNNYSRVQYVLTDLQLFLLSDEKAMSLVNKFDRLVGDRLVVVEGSLAVMIEATLSLEIPVSESHLCVHLLLLVVLVLKVPYVRPIDRLLIN